MTEERRMPYGVALKKIRDLYIDPETGKQAEDWPHASEFMEDVYHILHDAGVTFDDQGRPVEHRG